MDWKELLSDTTLRQLQLNWKEQLPRKGRNEIDFKPVAKLFNPMGATTILLTECDEDGLAFGLTDHGFGTPELGYISLDEVASVELPGGLRIEQDRYFEARQTLSQYAAEAQRLGRINA